MPGDSSSLQSTLESIFNDLSGKTAAEKATEITNAINTYIGTVKVATGITVSTTGTAAAQTGSTTSQGNLV